MSYSWGCIVRQCSCFRRGNVCERHDTYILLKSRQDVRTCSVKKKMLPRFSLTENFNARRTARPQDDLASGRPPSEIMSRPETTFPKARVYCICLCYYYTTTAFSVPAKVLVPRSVLHCRLKFLAVESVTIGRKMLHASHICRGLC